MDTIEKIWMSDSQGIKEIRLDWSNGRGHAVTVDRPYNKEQVAHALYKASLFVLSDPHLDKGE